MLVVRAIDQDGWIMGEDLVLDVTGSETLTEIQEWIKAQKHIGVTRQVIYKEGSAKPLEDKYLDWDLNRLGLYNGQMVELRPYRRDSWLWHPLEWYERSYLTQVKQFLKKENGIAPLTQIEALFALPPPLRRQSVRAVLRKYPEDLLLELDAITGRFHVKENVDMLLPSSA